MQGLSSPLRDYAGPSENINLDRAADYVCKLTDCYYYEQVDDLVAGQSTYCVAKVWKPKNYYTLDSNGNRIALQKEPTRSADRRLWGWRQWNPTAWPHHVIVDGSTILNVAPAPIADVAGGLIVDGFCLSTLPAVGHASHQWDTDDDECPLPQWAHDAVSYRYIYLRLRQLLAVEPAAKELMAQYNADFLNEIKQVETAAITAYKSIRFDRNGGAAYGYAGYY